jgi:hypothetical protein
MKARGRAGCCDNPRPHLFALETHFADRQAISRPAVLLTIVV